MHYIRSRGRAQSGWRGGRLAAHAVEPHARRLWCVPAAHHRADRPTSYRGWVRYTQPDRARAAMVASYQAVTDDAGKLDDDELARPSGCRGWSRGDLLFHMLLDAQRALVTFATPASGEADVDFVSYWAPFRPGAEGYAAHARFVRRVASSYRSDLVIAGLWAETATAAAHAAATLPAEAKVATQGHVLFAGDFLATLAVEATVHHLDLSAGDDSLAGPSRTRAWLSPGRRWTAYSASRFRWDGTTSATC